MGHLTHRERLPPSYLPKCKEKRMCQNGLIEKLPLITADKSFAFAARHHGVEVELIGAEEDSE